MDEARRHLPEGYSIRLMTEEDYAEIAGMLCTEWGCWNRRE